MRTHAFVLAVILFLVILSSGVGLSRNLSLNDPRPSGKPIASAIATVHKLIAIVTLVVLAVTVRNLHRGREFTSIELTAVGLAALFFLLMIVSGSLLSLGRPRSNAVLAVHKIGSVLTLIPTFGVIYLLTRGQ